MRALALVLLLAAPAGAESVLHPAPRAPATGEVLVYSTLDAPLAAPLIAAFQAENPTVAVRYEDLLASEIAARVVAETDAGGLTADIAFSSGMDQQMKLANDGYAQPVAVPGAAGWPAWANWRDTAFALTYEPAVMIWHRPSFPDGPPQSRQALADWLRGGGGRVGTYDIERSGVGFLFLARDNEHFPDIWSLVSAMAAAGLDTFPTSQEVIDRVADGRLALGYNILGSYAAEQVARHADLGLVLPRDFTVVVSRVALVPRAARNPFLGARFLAFLMSPGGQRLLAERVRLPPVLPGAAPMPFDAPPGQMRPVPVSPGLLVYLDQQKRARLVAQWRAAISPGP